MNIRDIERVQCGRCCPNTCPNKRAEGDKFVCSVHPQDGEKHPYEICDIKPWGWYKKGFACLAVMRALGQEDEPVDVQAGGQVLRVLNFGKK